MMKITGLSRLFKWENLHNWWLTKYFFAPLYLCIVKVCESLGLAVHLKVKLESIYVEVFSVSAMTIKCQYVTYFIQSIEV